MARSGYLLDSNILIRWVQQNDPEHALVQASLYRLVSSGTDLHYTSQNLGEFWNALTRPQARNGYGLSPQEVDELAQQVEDGFILLPDSIEVHHEWRRLLVDHAISGVQVHDARLAAAMRVHGVGQILTFNTRDFARFTNVDAVHPRDI